MVDRRSFGKIVGVGAAGASLTGWSDTGATADGAVGAPTGAVSPTPAPGHASFGRLRRVEAGELSVGYAEAGPAHGPAVVLLHGWPYD
ncbi:alpha/beta hydrolase, partial [Streptomyces sp. NPDC006333]